MNFADLYRFSNSLTDPVTPVEDLRKLVIRDHPTVHHVVFWACDLDPRVSRGHMVLDLERTSPYEDPHIVASIRYDRTLDACWRRYVCCKELMHVFDKTLERASNRERFLKLMDELENSPLPVDRSPMFNSERTAEWMAMLAICPQRLRDKYFDAFVKSTMSAEQIASALLIPTVLIKTIMSDRYFSSLEILTGEI